MKHALHIVTGAQGAGKSAAVAEFLALRSEFVAFDIDWLVEPASALCGRNVRAEAATWPPYNRLWLEVLHGVLRNGRGPVLFAPLDARDVQALPEWCLGVEWLLLDCDDATRCSRLALREGWTDGRIAEAIADAAHLRETVARRVDTASLSPQQVAAEVLRWLRDA